MGRETQHTDAEEDASRDSVRWIEGGAELAGVSAGALVTLIGGVPGALGGAAVGLAATKIFRRVAAAEIRRRLDEGEQLRSDGFFDPTGDGANPPAEELLDGLLQTAADSYEQRKVRFLGRLYAALAFDTSVSPAHANYLIGLARTLTFRQLAFMAVVSGADAAPAVAHAAQQDPPKDVMLNHDLGMEADELERLGLVERAESGIRSTFGGVSITPVSGTAIGGLTLPPSGRRLYELMGLDEIPSSAREEVLAELVWREQG